jgi:hypothetical protein
MILNYHKIGFRRRVDEMEEVYIIPFLASRPEIALASGKASFMKQPDM